MARHKYKQVLTSFSQKIQDKPYDKSELLTTATVSSKKKYLLKTPKVVEATKIYYDSPNELGMPLATTEVLNQPETYNLLWDNESLNYEILAENILDDLELFISPMSVAALMDTGWYTITDSISDKVGLWGYKGGSDFLSSSCHGSTLKNEYCSTLKEVSMDLLQRGYGECTEIPNSSGCYFVKRLTSSDCFNSNFLNVENPEATGEKMGNTSRMFKSDIFLTTQVAKTDKFAGFRCYVYDKSSKKVTIDATPTARTITCTTLGTEMTAQSPLVGKLTCPSVDWSYNTEFCSNRNGCNNKGWCSKQSLSCNCFDSGVTGDCNCDTEKKKYYDVDQQKCTLCVNNCLTCSSKNICLTCNSPYKHDDPTKTCYKDCPIGQYLSNKECKPCDKGCKECVVKDTCEFCMEEYAYHNQDLKCYQSCPEGYFFLNQPTNPTYPAICYICFKGCKKCDDGISCMECLDSYYYIKEPASCNICPDQCTACKSFTACSKCKSEYIFDVPNEACVKTCGEGTLYNSESDPRTCEACILGCQQCQDKQTCQTCYSYYTSVSGGLCVSKCPVNCLKCEIDSLEKCSENSCLSGFLLNKSKQCVSNKCQLAEYFDQQV